MAAPVPPLLQLEAVEAGYLPGINVLQQLTLEVRPGELVCLIGPNGAGKSTVLRAISGLLRVTAGTIRFDDQELRGLRPDQVLNHGIAHVPQGHSAFPEMTVHENLLMGAYSLKSRVRRRERLAAVYTMFPLLARRRRTRAGNLSGGQQKILEIGRALMLSPRMMLLDEPSLGLDPRMARTVFDTVRRLRDESGMTLLMVEQNAKSGLGISDRAYVLELGQEKLEGPAATLLDDPRVKELYLGGSLKS